MIADSSKPNKLRNVYTIRSTACLFFFSGTAGYVRHLHGGMAFSTFDGDNHSCAVTFYGSVVIFQLEFKWKVLRMQMNLKPLHGKYYSLKQKIIQNTKDYEIAVVYVSLAKFNSNKKNKRQLILL